MCQGGHRNSLRRIHGWKVDAQQLTGVGVWLVGGVSRKRSMYPELVRGHGRGCHHSMDSWNTAIQLQQCHLLLDLLLVMELLLNGL